MEHAARRLAAGLALPLKEAQVCDHTARVLQPGWRGRRTVQRPANPGAPGDSVKELHTLWNARQAMANIRHRAAAHHIESLDGKGDVESFADPPAMQVLFPVFIGRGDEWGVDRCKGDLLHDDRRERAVESNPLFDSHDPNFVPVYTLHSKAKLTPFEAELDHVARRTPANGAGRKLITSPGTGQSGARTGSARTRSRNLE